MRIHTNLAQSQSLMSGSSAFFLCARDHVERLSHLEVPVHEQLIQAMDRGVAAKALAAPLSFPMPHYVRATTSN